MASLSAASALAPSSVGAKVSKALPWVERYRPKKVTDVSSQDEVVRTLMSAIEQQSLPHLLFYGPPGTGKTSTALALCQALYGPQLYRTRTLEMNASDERGIQVVREKVKTFAQASVGTATTPGYPCPQFKVIILDEADAMTKDAQAALRRTIESHAKVTRFCLICNYVSRIIEPLASRCAKFRFKPLAAAAMDGRLRFIAAAEGLAYDDAVYAKILEVSRGDMRKAVTTLQSLSMLYGSTDASARGVEEVAGVLPQVEADQLWAAIQSNSFDRLQETLEAIFLEGFAAPTLVDKLLELVIAAPALSDAQKGKVALALGRVDKCLADGASDHLQLLDGAAEAMRIINAC